MVYIRLSTMMAKPGREGEVAAIMDKLIAFYREQPGFVAGRGIKAADEVGAIGRMTVWESMAQADHTAQSNHVLSLRSELTPLIQDASHEEQGFHATAEGERLTDLLASLRA